MAFIPSPEPECPILVPIPGETRTNIWGVTADTAAAAGEGVSVGRLADVQGAPGTGRHQRDCVLGWIIEDMSKRTHLKDEVPPPLMTSEPGSFARHTIVDRKPQIIRQVIADNGYPPEMVQQLEAFREEIASQPIRPLHEQAPDAESWNQELVQYQGKTWLDVPWYLAETYFYRRLLEAVRYFQQGPWHNHDPFGRQKRQQIEGAVERLAGDWGPLAGVGPALALEALLHSSLWGNRADLSNETIRLAIRGGLDAREEKHNVLIDDTEAVCRYVMGGLERVDFINDNVGLDLLFDLALVDLLLVQGWVGRVVLHLKDWPFFVSDAMPRDAGETMSLLVASPSPSVRALGERLRADLAAGCLVLAADPFWTSPSMFRQFTPSLRSALGKSNLVILKGDVNYRRLLDDRHWPHTARLEEIAVYFPAPFLVLRTLKGEILVGLAPGQAETLAAEDPTWLINGQRGLIQFCVPSHQMLTHP
jgi:hypothetical protein